MFTILTWENARLGDDWIKPWKIKSTAYILCKLLKTSKVLYLRVSLSTTDRRLLATNIEIIIGLGFLFKAQRTLRWVSI